VGKAEEDLSKYGKLLARTLLGLASILLIWVVITVHHLSIDVAVIKSQLTHMVTLWKTSR